MDGATIYRVVFGEDVQPDAWQLALTTDVWPRVLVAPTGSGKTAAVTLGWAAHRIRNPKHTPRRLVWCLPMRTLVEQTANAVSDWLAKLAAHVDGNGRLPKPEDVQVLMGGEDASGWLDHPERPGCSVRTQDMPLSRALMRGYAGHRGSSRTARCRGVKAGPAAAPDGRLARLARAGVLRRHSLRWNVHELRKPRSDAT